MPIVARGRVKAQWRAVNCCCSDGVVRKTIADDSTRRPYRGGRSIASCRPLMTSRWALCAAYPPVLIPALFAVIISSLRTPLFVRSVTFRRMKVLQYLLTGRLHMFALLALTGGSLFSGEPWCRPTSFLPRHQVDDLKLSAIHMGMV